MNTHLPCLQSMAKLASVALLLAAAMAHVPPVIADAVFGTVVVGVTPPQTTVQAGQQFQVSLLVDAGSQPVDVVDSFLSFDPAGIQVLQITPGTALPTVLATSFDNTAGRASYSAGKQLGGPDPSGTFVLATIRFQARSTAAVGPTTLSFVFQPPVHNTDAFYRGESVLGAAANGSVTIQPAAPCYDFDGDHAVRARDVMLVAARFENPQAYQAQYDLNHDGVITVADVVMAAGSWNMLCG